MRSYFTIVLAGAVVVIVALFMLTYTVRFTETGVITTFGRASENSVVSDPGIKFRWPYPVQSVTLYDTRSRFLRTQSETQQTSDSRQIVVESFMLWRVDDALAFHKSFSGQGDEARDHYRAAQDILEPQLRAAMSEVGRYNLTDLFTPVTNASKIPELEQAIQRRLAASGSSAANGGFSLSDFGIVVEMIGISRVQFPEETTKDVFERMKSSRSRIASEAISEGNAQASKIQKDAETSASLIRSFAEQRAAQIRSQGDREAARYLADLAEDPDLAVLIETFAFMKNLISRRTTLVLPTTMPGMEFFDPSAIQSLAGDDRNASNDSEANAR